MHGQLQSTRCLLNLFSKHPLPGEQRGILQEHKGLIPQGLLAVVQRACVVGALVILQLYIGIAGACPVVGRELPALQHLQQATCSQCRILEGGNPPAIQLPQRSNRWSKIEHNMDDLAKHKHSYISIAKHKHEHPHTHTHTI